MKALIPAAGMGTRWHPWSRTIPKELVPLGQYPAIHYVLNEASAAGIDKIGIVLSKPKKILSEYIKTVWSPEHPGIRLEFFLQHAPQGVADALLCALPWVKDNPVAVLYPDEIHPHNNGMERLKRFYDRAPGTWVGLTNIKQERRQSGFEVEPADADVFKVKGFAHDKTARQVLYGTARYILGNGLQYFDEYLQRCGKKEGQELDDDKLFDSLWNGQVFGTVLPGPIHDTGSPENWLCAVKDCMDTKKQLYKKA